MLDEKHICDLVGQLGTAAAMLLEDRHLELVTSPRDLAAAAAIAATLATLGAELTALGAAAGVLVNQAEKQDDQAS
jgi:Na+/H+ antiporter NhaD/arsenite permease-like protein